MAPRASDVERGTARRSPRAQRLRRSSDVRSALTAGRFGTRALVVHGRRRGDEGPPRVTVVAGKKVGNAVRRNRVKRRLRGALSQRDLPVGFDLVVVGRPPAADVAFAALVHDLERGLTDLVRRS